MRGTAVPVPGKIINVLNTARERARKPVHDLGVIRLVMLDAMGRGRLKEPNTQLGVRGRKERRHRKPITQSVGSGTVNGQQQGRYRRRASGPEGGSRLGHVGTDLKNRV